MSLRFGKMTPEERDLAEATLRRWLQYPRHRDVVPGTRTFYHLCGAAARFARHGAPPGYRARAAYRSHRARRRNKEMRALYGDPSAPAPPSPQ